MEENIDSLVWLIDGHINKQFYFTKNSFDKHRRREEQSCMYLLENGKPTIFSKVLFVFCQKILFFNQKKCFFFLFVCKTNLMFFVFQTVLTNSPNLT